MHALEREFPQLFSKNGKTTLPHGIECNQGWIPLIRELCQKLVDSGFKGNVVEVKEKFGQLRFYTTGSMTGEQRELVSEYECASARVCEDCGQPGKITTVKGWPQTLCEECRRKKNETP